MEGRVAILVDGTPTAIIIPHIFVEEFQSVDDYSNRPYYATFNQNIKVLFHFSRQYLYPVFILRLLNFIPSIFRKACF